MKDSVFEFELKIDQSIRESKLSELMDRFEKLEGFVSAKYRPGLVGTVLALRVQFDNEATGTKLHRKVSNILIREKSVIVVSAKTCSSDFG